MGDGFTGQKT